MDLAAARLIVEKHDWFLTILAAAIRPHIRRAGGFLVLFPQDLIRRLIAMNERLRRKSQSQRIVDAMQVPLARPVTQ